MSTTHPTRRTVRLPHLLALAVSCVLAPVSIAADDEKAPLLNPKADTPGLKVGDPAPTMTLANADGEQIDLADLYKEKGPIVLTFYRGGWCPFCNTALKDWVGRIDELERAGGTFVAISPETAEHAVKTRDEAGGEYLALVDAEGEAMRAFRVGFEQRSYRGMVRRHNASGRAELPAPATYIIDADGVIRWVFADWDYKKRADVDEVIEEVRTLADDRG